MAGLTAIDILISPGHHTIERARAVNARLRKSVPGGNADIHVAFDAVEPPGRQDGT